MHINGGAGVQFTQCPSLVVSWFNGGRQSLVANAKKDNPLVSLFIRDQGAIEVCKAQVSEARTGEADGPQPDPRVVERKSNSTSKIDYTATAVLGQWWMRCRERQNVDALLSLRITKENR